MTLWCQWQKSVIAALYTHVGATGFRGLLAESCPASGLEFSESAAPYHCSTLETRRHLAVSSAAVAEGEKKKKMSIFDDWLHWHRMTGFLFAGPHQCFIVRQTSKIGRCRRSPCQSSPQRNILSPKGVYVSRPLPPPAPLQFENL